MSLILGNFVYGRSAVNANCGPATTCIHLYSNLDDDFATVSASAYFDGILGNQASRTDDVTRPVQVGDAILAQGSDQTDFLLITAISPNVTTEALVTAGDIPDGSITTAKLAAQSVTLAKLADGVAPSHVVKYAGFHTTAGGSATETIPLVAIANGDIAFTELADNGTNNVTLLYSDTDPGVGIAVTFSADPGADTSVKYQVLVAAS